MTIPQEIRRLLEAALPAAQAFLRDLVEINSHTRNPDGVARNASRIMEQFAPFGWTCHTQACQQPGTGEHLVLDSGGRGRPILLISHLDTVYPQEEQARAYGGWEESNDVVVGPGVYDIKGGTAMLWLVLQTLASLDIDAFRRVRWICAWNAAEEELVSDFAALCLSLCPSPPVAALVFEGDNGREGEREILCARHGLARFRVTAAGRGTHSGNGHELGINAIVDLSRVITELAAFTDYGRNTTLNVGIVRGGEATNRVPDFAEALLEVRFADPAHFAMVKEKMDGLAKCPASENGSRIGVEMLDLIPPLVSTPESEQILRIWQEEALSMGVNLGVGRRRGLSDANFFAGSVPVVDGLGPSGGNAHGIERTETGSRITEYLNINSLFLKAAINVAALRRLAIAASTEWRRFP